LAMLQSVGKRRRRRRHRRRLAPSKLLCDGDDSDCCITEHFLSDDAVLSIFAAVYTSSPVHLGHGWRNIDIDKYRAHYSVEASRRIPWCRSRGRRGKSKSKERATQHERMAGDVCELLFRERSVEVNNNSHCLVRPDWPPHATGNGASWPGGHHFWFPFWKLARVWRSSADRGYPHSPPVEQEDGQANLSAAEPLPTRPPD